MNPCISVKSGFKSENIQIMYNVWAVTLFRTLLTCRNLRPSAGLHDVSS